jgi:hypothetical protein
MPELDDELRRIAGQGEAGARPLSAAEVMRLGDRRRSRAVIRDCAIAAAAAVVIVIAVLAGVTASKHVAPVRPATHPASPSPGPAPQKTPAPTATPSPSRPPAGPSPLPSRSPAGTSASPSADTASHGKAAADPPRPRPARS